MGNINTIEVFQDLNGIYIEAIVPPGKKVVLTKFGGYRLENIEQEVRHETKYNYRELYENIFVGCFFVSFVIIIILLVYWCVNFMLDLIF